MYILREHFHQKGAPHERQFSWHLSNIFASILGANKAPGGHSFAKKWFHCLRAPPWCSSAQTHVRIPMGKLYRQIDKNCSGGNAKSCFAIRILMANIWWPTQLPNQHVWAKVAVDNKPSPSFLPNTTNLHWVAIKSYLTVCLCASFRKKRVFDERYFPEGPVITYPCIK